MTRNPKPNILPEDIQQVADEAVAPPLVLDTYLSRQGVIDRIVDAIGLSITPTAGSLTHIELAALYRAVSDDGRTPRTIRGDRAKYAIITDLADQYGFEAAPEQDTLRKSQLVHILLAEATGTRPDPFTLPSDPDEPTDATDAVPVLGAD